VLRAGRSEVARWVRDTPPGVEDRSAFLLKLRADAAIGPLGLDGEPSMLIDAHRARLETCREIERRDFAGRDLTRARRLQYAILRAGIEQERTWLAWADDVGSLLRAPAKR